MHLDSYGLPVQSDGDANDQLQRVGMIECGFQFAELEVMREWQDIADDCYDALHENLQPEPGIYSRYTGAPTNNVSADQLVAALAAWVALGESKQIAKLFARCLSRLGFAQNYKDGLNDDQRTKLPDFMYFRALPLFVRAHELVFLAYIWACVGIAFYVDAILGNILLWLPEVLLMLLALSAVGPVWHDGKLLPSKRKDTDVDDNNTILTLFVCSRRLATPLSKLALKLYLKHRPWNLGCIGYGPDSTGLVQEVRDAYHPVVGALRHYHRAESGGNPEIAELWRPIIEREVGDDRRETT